MAQIMEIIEAVKQEQYRKTTAIPFGFEGIIHYCMQHGQTSSISTENFTIPS